MTHSKSVTSESVSLESVLTPKNYPPRLYPYTPEIQRKVEDLILETDALLLKLQQEKHELSLDHFEPVIECKTLFVTVS